MKNIDVSELMNTIANIGVIAGLIFVGPFDQNKKDGPNRYWTVSFENRTDRVVAE